MTKQAIYTKKLTVPRAQKGVLGLLLASDSQRPWSVAEIERERGEHMGPSTRWQAFTLAGLVHRCDEFVFATRAALRMDSLSL